MINKVIANPELISEYNISEKNKEKIEKIYWKIKRLFNKSWKIIKSKSLSIKEKRNQIKIINNSIENFEYELQKLWWFSQDNSYHTWWYQNPNCKCSKMDNQDLMGIEQKIITESCPLHWRIYN